MKTDSAPLIPLTRENDVNYKGHMRNPCSYKEHPTNPVFVCCLYPDLMQKLITAPGSMLRKPKGHRLFWLRTLVECISTSSQFVFETFPPPGTNNQQNKLAARTLFQLDGDMLLKIDENILARTDGIDIIKAHLNWTNWCFEQLKGALSFTRSLRCVQRLLYIIAVLPFGYGVVQGVTEPTWWLLVILWGIMWGIMWGYIARKLISVCLKRIIIKQSL